MLTDTAEFNLTACHEHPEQVKHLDSYAPKKVRFAADAYDAHVGGNNPSNGSYGLSSQSHRGVARAGPFDRLTKISEEEERSPLTEEQVETDNLAQDLPKAKTTTSKLLNRNSVIENGDIPPNTSPPPPPPATVRRCNSLPEEKLRPGIHKLLLEHSRRSPSANVIKKEFRYASLKKVDREVCRRSYVPLISNKDLLLGPDLYQSLLAHSRRSPSANVIKKEYRYASLKSVDNTACRRRSEPLISITKDLLLDPDVYELLLAHSRRSPSANVIKKEFRYACLRKVNNAARGIDDDVSSISTMFSNFATSFDDDDDDDDDDDQDHRYSSFYVYDWLMDLEPMMPLPDMFPYYEPTAYSDGGRRMSGSTLQSELVLSTTTTTASSSVVSGCNSERNTG